MAIRFAFLDKITGAGGSEAVKGGINKLAISSNPILTSVLWVIILGGVLFYLWRRWKYKIRIIIRDQTAGEPLIEYDVARKVVDKKNNLIANFLLWKRKNAIVHNISQDHVYIDSKGKMSILLDKIGDNVYVANKFAEAYHNSAGLPIQQVDLAFLESQLRKNKEMFEKGSFWKEHGATIAVFGGLLVIAFLLWLASGNIAKAGQAIAQALNSFKAGTIPPAG